MKFINLCFFILFANPILAQNIEILILSGNCYKQGQVLKVGDRLSEQDILKTDSSSYLLLAINDSVPLELYGKTSYHLSKIPKNTFSYPQEYCQKALSILKGGLKQYAQRKYKYNMHEGVYGVPTVRGRGECLFGKKLTLKKYPYRGDEYEGNMRFRVFIEVINLIVDKKEDKIIDIIPIMILDTLLQDSTFILNFEKFPILKTHFYNNQIINLKFRFSASNFLVFLILFHLYGYKFLFFIGK